jgi:hypothetical protein
MQNGSCIEFRVEVKFGNNEVKMLKNQTNNHHVQKDIFEFLKIMTMKHKINVHYEVNKNNKIRIFLFLCNLINRRSLMFFNKIIQ